ncbi:MAG: ABC transporter permease [Pseudobdellovibrionaceae bacterium]
MAEALTQEIQFSDQERIKAEQALTMSQIVFRQFVEHKLAVAGLISIIILSLIALGAPLIQKATGLNPDAQNVFSRFQPFMTRVSVAQDQKEIVVEKFIAENPGLAQALSDSLVSKEIFPGVASTDVLYELVTQKTKGEILTILKAERKENTIGLIEQVRGFETLHVLGTDELGRDVLIRVIYGARVSLGVGILVALAAGIVGLLIGSLAGFYGGFVDNALMRVTDALLSLPIMPILIVVSAIDLNKIGFLRFIMDSENQSILKLVFCICAFSWMTTARLVRGSILSLREREFILAAKTLGAKDSTIIVRHMFPNVIAPLLVSVTLGVGSSILFEAALSYLGLGVQPPTPSWGNMLFNAQELIYEAPLLTIIPGLLILITTISFNYLGDGLQDAIDPKAIRR